MLQLLPLRHPCDTLLPLLHLLRLRHAPAQARVSSLEHLSVLEATVAAKQRAYDEARQKGRELQRGAKEQDRELAQVAREDPAKELAVLGEEVRVARRQLAKLSEDNAKEEKEGQLAQRRVADLEAEAEATQRQLDAGAGARREREEEKARAARAKEAEAAKLQQQAAEEAASGAAEASEHRQQLARTEQQVKMLRTEVKALEGHLKRKEREAIELKIKLKKQQARSRANADGADAYMQY